MKAAELLGISLDTSSDSEGESTDSPNEEEKSAKQPTTTKTTTTTSTSAGPRTLHSQSARPGRSQSHINPHKRVKHAGSMPKPRRASDSHIVVNNNVNPTKHSSPLSKSSSNTPRQSPSATRPSSKKSSHTSSSKSEQRKHKRRQSFIHSKPSTSRCFLCHFLISLSPAFFPLPLFLCRITPITTRTTNGTGVQNITRHPATISITSCRETGARDRL
eukprot:TRINITY_DN6799_c0_g1_i1.p1 TRINITY_DN6799_c0_g1~~TRINITY_DN6799_c0_g1_i1.p1  ORF type:complete len:217 (+),score=7.98 TRINITY_DN6799_c0_g1_i1:94-744(+)